MQRHHTSQQAETATAVVATGAAGGGGHQRAQAYIMLDPSRQSSSKGSYQIQPQHFLIKEEMGTRLISSAATAAVTPIHINLNQQIGSQDPRHGGSGGGNVMMMPKDEGGNTSSQASNSGGKFKSYLNISSSKKFNECQPMIPQIQIQQLQSKQQQSSDSTPRKQIQTRHLSIGVSGEAAILLNPSDDVWKSSQQSVMINNFVPQ